MNGVAARRPYAGGIVGEHDMRCGHVVSEEAMVRDIRLMKDQRQHCALLALPMRRALVRAV